MARAYKALGRKYMVSGTEIDRILYIKTLPLQILGEFENSVFLLEKKKTDNRLRHCRLRNLYC